MKKKVVKTHVKKGVRRFFTFGFFAIAIIIIVLINIFGIVNQIVDKYKEAEQLENDLSILKNNEQELNNEILKLQDPDYLARYAREKYFYSKKDELIIRIPTK